MPVVHLQIAPAATGGQLAEDGRALPALLPGRPHEGDHEEHQPGQTEGSQDVDHVTTGDSGREEGTVTRRATSVTRPVAGSSSRL